MSSIITPTDHERAEWGRMAADAAQKGRTIQAHTYAAHSKGTGALTLKQFDALQVNYRRWLVFGWSAVEG